MNQPNGYAEVSAGGEWTPVALGGHKAIIKKLEERKNKSGGDMVVAAIDFDKTDVQPGYFTQAFKEDIRPDKKWPNAGMLYINVCAPDGKCSKAFKGFITSFEKSNNVNAVWGEGFAAQFAGKRLGVVYGEVEEEYNGKVSTKHKFKWCCEYDKATEAKVPEKVELANKPAASTRNDDFITVKDDVEECPF